MPQLQFLLFSRMNMMFYLICHILNISNIFISFFYSILHNIPHFLYCIVIFMCLRIWIVNSIIFKSFHYFLRNIIGCKLTVFIYNSTFVNSILSVKESKLLYFSSFILITCNKNAYINILIYTINKPVGYTASPSMLYIRSGIHVHCQDA